MILEGGKEEGGREGGRREGREGERGRGREGRKRGSERRGRGGLVHHVYRTILTTPLTPTKLTKVLAYTHMYTQTQKVTDSVKNRQREP